jgi:AcrR family transcriptional regulator
MDAERAVKRKYDATARRARAEAARHRIVAAARESFESNGYAATTMDGVAEAAQVSVETVYKSFGSKLALLQRVIDFNLAGDSAEVPLAERSIFTEVRDEPDQVRQVELLARNARTVLERAGPLQWAIRVAAENEPELAELVARYNAMRLRAMTTFIAWIAERGRLRDEITIDEAALTYWTVSSTEVHHFLRGLGGLSANDYERWLASSLKALLLPASDQ